MTDLDRARTALSQSETLLSQARQEIRDLKIAKQKAEQLGREGGIRDAIKVQDPYTAGQLAGKELLAPYTEHLGSCVVEKRTQKHCPCGLTAALMKQPKVTERI